MSKPVSREVIIHGKAASAMRKARIFIRDKSLAPAFSWEWQERVYLSKPWPAIKVTLDPGKLKMGKFSSFLVFDHDDRDIPEWEIVIGGEILGRLYVPQRSEIKFRNFEPYRSYVKEIVIRSYNLYPFMITGYETSVENLEVTGLNKMSKGDQTVYFHFTPDETDRMFNTEVTLYTDQKDQPEIKVNVSAYHLR